MDKITSSYLKAESIEKIRNYLETNNLKVLTLNGFLSKEYFDLIKNKVKSIKLTEEYLPLSHSYQVSELKEIELINLIKNYLSNLLNKKISKTEAFVKRINHKNYTILSDKPEKKKIKLFLYIEKEISSEAGSYPVFIKNEDSLTLIPEENSLTIFIEDGSKDFIKYVDARAKNSKNLFIELILK